MELGPLEENDATDGAGERPMMVLLGEICTLRIL